MKQCYITFRSVTPAQQAQRALRLEGIETALTRTPKWMQEQGCGYSLRIHRADALRCRTLLEEKGIDLRRIYLQTAGESFEELVL